ncbi:hypothetical protein [Halococcus hamelinensis]|uniref:Uncharacterized protein n=1 Tax=Halococcus hamelinensis 100A6 TaxID=1132509 RepID=M0LYG5_9EURY|nr:hypothetical protein [Halococcus hamelinensis]EMA38476.1 hypothetical protein C447_09987 [Halococcus hamelinensis 100A6]
MSATNSTSDTDSIEQYWRLAGVPLDLHDGPEPTITPGTSYDCTALTTLQSDSPEGEWGSATERHRSLLAYGARAGKYTLHESGGRVAYTEQHDGAVPNGTLAVSLRPPVDSMFVHGGWFIVESVENASPNPEMPQLSIGLVYLAPLDRYPTRSTLAYDLEAPAL